jgi:hypothetical protein
LKPQLEKLAPKDRDEIHFQAKIIFTQKIELISYRFLPRKMDSVLTKLCMLTDFYPEKWTNFQQNYVCLQIFTQKEWTQSYDATVVVRLGIILCT